MNVWDWANAHPWPFTLLAFPVLLFVMGWVNSILKALLIGTKKEEKKDGK